MGDVGRTAVGLTAPGVSEGNLVAAALLERSVLGALVTPEVTVLPACFAVWRLLPAPHRVGIALGLAAVGVAVSGWNFHVVVDVSSQ